MTKPHTITLSHNQARGLLFLLGGRHQHLGLEAHLVEALDEVETALRQSTGTSPPLHEEPTGLPAKIVGVIDGMAVDVHGQGWLVDKSGPEPRWKAADVRPPSPEASPEAVQAASEALHAATGSGRQKSAKAST